MSLGVTPAVGYFGNLTRGAIASSCTTTVVDNSGSNDSDNGSSNSSTLGSGEASLESFELNDDEDEVAEGDSEVVAVIEFDVEDGDARIERLDLSFDSSSITSSGEDEPWDAFDEVRLLVDGDEIASADVTDEDDWLDEDGPVYTFRFSGLDYTVMEGDMAEIEVEITANDHVDDAGTNAEWEIFVDSDDVRAIDGEGINQYTGNSSETVTFEIVSEGEGDDLDLESSDDEIDEDTIILDTDDQTEAPIFAFVLSADDSDNDIEINEIEINIEISSATGSIEDIAKDFWIEIDGEKIDAENYNDDNSTTTLTFDVDGDVTIKDGDEVEVVLYVDFKEMESDSDYQGVTIVATVDGADVEAEGRDEIKTSDVDGSAEGEEQTLRSQGIDVEVVSVDADSTGTDDTIGKFSFEVDISAIGETAWVELSAVRGTTTDDFGFEVLILDGNNSVITTGTTTFSFDSDRSPSNSDRVRVADKQTEGFEITVFFEAETAGTYKALLHSVNFNDNDNDGDSVETLTPATDYRTQATYVETIN